MTARTWTRIYILEKHKYLKNRASRCFWSFQLWRRWFKDNMDEAAGFKVIRVFQPWQQRVTARWETQTALSRVRKRRIRMMARMRMSGEKYEDESEYCTMKMKWENLNCIVPEQMSSKIQDTGRRSSENIDNHFDFLLLLVLLVLLLLLLLILSLFLLLLLFVIVIV